MEDQSQPPRGPREITEIAATIRENAQRWGYSLQSAKDEISRLEARIQTHSSTGGGLVKDQYGDEKRVIELKQAQEGLRDNLQE